MKRRKKSEALARRKRHPESQTQRARLPAGWIYASIGQLCAVNPGLSDPPEEDAVVSFVPMRAVSDELGEITDFEIRPYHSVRTGYTQFADGDVILAKITPSMENGKSAVARNLSGGIGCGSTEFFVLRSRGAVMPEYLHRYLRQASFRRDARAAMRGAGGHARVPRAFIEKTVIPLAPINEQRRIVARLAELDTQSRRARVHLAEIPAKLNESRQALLASAFSGALTADWRKANKRVRLSEFMERLLQCRQADWEKNEGRRRERRGRAADKGAWKSKYQPPKHFDIRPPHSLPPTWVYVSAETCAWEVTVGYVGPMRSEYVPTGIPFLRSQNVRENRYDSKDLVFIRRSFHETISKSALGPGDVVIVRTGAPGSSCVIPDELREANCSDLVIARPNSMVLPNYLSLYINSPGARHQIFGLQVGIAQQHFNVRAMSRLGVPLAPPAEQRKLVQQLESALAQLEGAAVAHATAIAELDAVEQSVLARAFHGDLVEQNPSDEAAGALIRRIVSDAEDKPKTNQHMPRKKRAAVTREPRALLEVLRATSGSMSPEELFREARRDETNLEEVERFYAELRDLVKKGHVREKRPDSATVRLTAKS
jgi:type I restriction enzyme, S subunit